MKKILNKKSVKKEAFKIEDAVLRSFIRSLKENKKAIYFFCTISRDTSLLRYLLKGKYQVPSSPLSTAKTFGEMLPLLSELTSAMVKDNAVTINDDYDKINVTINHLLHFFVEPIGVSMEEICKYGENIYNLTCNKIFGDSIELVNERNKKMEEIELRAKKKMPKNAGGIMLGQAPDGNNDSHMEWTDFDPFDDIEGEHGGILWD